MPKGSVEGALGRSMAQGGMQNGMAGAGGLNMPEGANPTEVIQAALGELQETGRKLGALQETSGDLMTQLHECNSVKSELALLEEDAAVYKLVGPVLVKQELEEARSNVDKRIGHIEGEFRRTEQIMQDTAQLRDAQQGAIYKTQQALQQVAADAEKQQQIAEGGGGAPGGADMGDQIAASMGASGPEVRMEGPGM